LGQPPVSPARDAAATGARDDAVQTASRADLAHGEQFSWLRMSPNQVRVRGVSAGQEGFERGRIGLERME
jgi:hypothetical protein